MKKSLSWFIALAFIALAGYQFYKHKAVPVAQNISQNPIEEYEAPNLPEHLEDKYDVIVIGGEPEGVAAAVSAARNGAKTLLVENRAELGGLFTYGMLNFLDIPQGENGKSVSKGIYEEWHKLVGGDNAFGILEAKSAFKNLVDKEHNLTLAIETEVVESKKELSNLYAVTLKNEYGEQTVSGKIFIDATQDADFAAMSGAPYFTGGEDIGIKDKKMAVTLMLHLKNVDWSKVKETAKSQKFGYAEVTESVAWGFSDLHYSYKPREKSTRLRGLNLVKVEDEYFINALQIFGIDGLSEESKREAIEKGKRETEHILSYLQKEFPGFKHAEIASHPTELYVRETRHIWAEYQLSMSDVWTNRDHWDNIGFGAYPVDVQAQTPQDYGYVLSDPKQYAIPFRSLVPLEVEGLLIVGRSAGFSSLAAGSARVVPTGMVAGEAAGAAAALAINNEITPRELSKDKKMIDKLRETLARQGAFVDHIKTDYPYEEEWYDQSIQTLMNYGLVVGGYSNDLKVDEPVWRHSFANMLKGAIQRANPEKFKELQNRLEMVYAGEFGKANSPIQRDDIESILKEVFYEGDQEVNWARLTEDDVISEDTVSRIQKNKELTSKEVYAIVASVIEYVKEN
ncbi:FAD dependent oxidoreductase [Cytobacillus firmus]|uniref:FAD dependent oxidoreductase n=2 Tax=Cytobacillus TaxID=2675230 RepID=A0A366JSF0_CYTFI|nr:MULTISPECIES: FAD-dependent oxidoreductase [Cytobacillus]RBP91526.1 FAD dependent oxidoreductase [Cytobacillus firmus]TDX41726.1 FAD dependent oxidoreductase [Cytobacillus oceanisediminis]